MSIKVILFDLDGTLLPMNQDLFIGTYFKAIASKLARIGYNPEDLIKTIYKGTYAMIQNDGTKSNEEKFWEVFSGIYGEERLKDKPLFDEFYKNEFQNIKSVCGFSKKAKETVDKLKQMGYRVILATNPLFPLIATESRIRWAGLEPEDFEYFTTYENSSYCKPNPLYYKEITDKLGINPEDCIMIGNDVEDDMIAKSIGMKVFLLTDCLINNKEKDISEFPQGSFDDIFNVL